jgi:Ca2+-binding EF-hand superfamily protein
MNTQRGEEKTARGTTRKIRFTNAELKWIERTADIESAIAMNKFITLINKSNYDKLTEEEKKMLQDISKELIDLYLFLKELRIKLELWDCRYDVNNGFEVIDKDGGEEKK